MTYPIPSDALDDRLAFVGTAGSGKTYAAGTAVERLLHRSARVVIIDPLDVWFGLRLAPDGVKPSRFEVVIFGGAHGDLPLTENAGAVIGEAVARAKESCIVSLGALGTKASERRFMLAFLTAFYRSAGGEPVHLVFDEADMFAPQKLLDKEGDAAKLLGMMETIVRRGRRLGIIPWLITQRPAVLSKDVLSQADGLVALKLTSSQDRDAIGAWIEGQADRTEWNAMKASLPTMQLGQGVIWIPGRSVLATKRFPEKATFDSSRTPKRGESRRATELAPLNIGALKDRLSTVEAETKANDPKALRAEIARLKADLQKAATNIPKNIPAPDPKAIEDAERRGYSKGKIDGYSAGVADATDDLARIHVVVSEAIGAALKEVAARTADHRARADKLIPTIAVKEPATIGRALQAMQVQRKPAGDAGLSRPQQKIIDALTLWKSLGHEAPTREMIAAVAGYSPSSGGFNNLIGGLHRAGHLAIPAPGRASLASGAGDRLMNMAEARDAMLSVLSTPQRRLVAAMDGTDSVSRDDLGARTEYSPSSGGFNNLIGSLCTLGIMTKPAPGHVALSDWAAELLA